MTTHSIHGRMSVDHGWYLLKTGVEGELDIMAAHQHYSKTWRYVKATPEKEKTVESKKYICTVADTPAYIVGNVYESQGYDERGNPRFVNERGDICEIGCPMQGNLWSFEEVVEAPPVTVEQVVDAGDIVKCTYAETDRFTVGKEYTVLDTSGSFFSLFDDRTGAITQGLPLEGCLWKFKVVAKVSPQEVETVVAPHQESRGIKIGDRLRCTHSKVTDRYTEGEIYTVKSFDSDGDYILPEDDGFVSDVGRPLIGSLWHFEVVEPITTIVESETLVSLLKASEEDFEALRVYTREDLMDSLEVHRILRKG